MDRRTWRGNRGPAHGAKPALRGKLFPPWRFWLVMGLGIGGLCGPVVAGNDADLVLRIDYALSSLQRLASGIPRELPDDLLPAREIGCPGQTCEHPALAVDDQLHILPPRSSFLPGAVPIAMLQTQHGGRAGPGNQMPPAAAERQASVSSSVEAARRAGGAPGTMPDPQLAGLVRSSAIQRTTSCETCLVNWATSVIRQTR